MLFFFGITLLNAQEYAQVDTVVASYPSSFQSIEEFAQRIEKDFDSDAEKVRAAYCWMANHIQYNYEILGSGQTGYPEIKITNYKDSEDYQYQYRKIFATYTLQYKLSVCEGYSQLLFYVCEAMGIKAKVINGNVLKPSYEYGYIPKTTTHAWNAVFYNNQWNLIDVTWSRDNNRNNPNHVRFNGIYFNVPPERMIINHFPEEPEWQLLDKPISKQEFYTQPAVYTPYIPLSMDLDKSIKGLIKAKVNDSITLKFTKIDSSESYHYKYSRDKYSTALPIEKVGDAYFAKIPFHGTKKDILTIFTTTKGILRFYITPTR